MLTSHDVRWSHLRHAVASVIKRFAGFETRSVSPAHTRWILSEYLFVKIKLDLFKLARLFQAHTMADSSVEVKHEEIYRYRRKV